MVRLLSLPTGVQFYQGAGRFDPVEPRAPPLVHRVSLVTSRVGKALVAEGDPLGRCAALVSVVQGAGLVLTPVVPKAPGAEGASLVHRSQLLIDL